LTAETSGVEVGGAGVGGTKGVVSDGVRFDGVDPVGRVGGWGVCVWSEVELVEDNIVGVAGKLEAVGSPGTSGEVWFEEPLGGIQ
jgi:hypothetical protein